MIFNYFIRFLMVFFNFRKNERRSGRQRWFYCPPGGEFRFLSHEICKKMWVSGISVKAIRDHNPYESVVCFFTTDDHRFEHGFPEILFALPCESVVFLFTTDSLTPAESCSHPNLILFAAPGKNSSRKFLAALPDTVISAPQWCLFPTRSRHLVHLP